MNTDSLDSRETIRRQCDEIRDMFYPIGLLIFRRRTTGFLFTSNV